MSFNEFSVILRLAKAWMLWNQLAMVAASPSCPAMRCVCGFSQQLNKLIKLIANYVACSFSFYFQLATPTLTPTSTTTASVTVTTTRQPQIELSSTTTDVSTDYVDFRRSFSTNAFKLSSIKILCPLKHFLIFIAS